MTQMPISMGPNAAVRRPRWGVAVKVALLALLMLAGGILLAMQICNPPSHN